MGENSSTQSRENGLTFRKLMAWKKWKSGLTDSTISFPNTKRQKCHVLLIMWNHLNDLMSVAASTGRVCDSCKAIRTITHGLQMMTDKSVIPSECIILLNLHSVTGDKKNGLLAKKTT